MTVLYGGRGGLTARDQIVDQDTRGILDAAETGDWAGHALAAADFNSDGVDDLALGVFSEGVDGKPNAGAVNVIYGTKDVGLTGRGDRFVSQALDSIPGDADKNDWFGATLTVGDFNGDRPTTWWSAHPMTPSAAQRTPGSATYIPGSTSGLVLARSTFLALGQVSSGGGGRALRRGTRGWRRERRRLRRTRGELTVVRPGRRVSRQLGRPDRHRRTDTDPGPARRTRTGPGLGVLRRGAPVRPLGHAARRGPAIGMAHANLNVDGTKIQSGAVAEISSRGGVLDCPRTGSITDGAPDVPGTAVKWEEFGPALPGSGTVHTMRGPATSTPSRYQMSGREELRCRVSAVLVAHGRISGEPDQRCPGRHPCAPTGLVTHSDGPLRL